MGDTAALRDAREPDRLVGFSVAHEMKTPIAAVQAACAQLSKNLQSLLQSIRQAGEGRAGMPDLLGFLANSLAAPRTHVPATGLDALRLAGQLEARLEDLGLGDRAGECARVLLRGGWDKELDEIVPFLLGEEPSSLLPVLDAVGKIRSNLASIEASSESLQALTSAFRSGLAEREGSPSAFGVKPAIERALATVQHEAAPGTGIEVRCEEGLQLVGVEAKFRQVVVNLVTNALAAVERGGWVRVSAASEGEHVVLRVQDSGPGVRVEMRDALFTPFATFRRDGRGTGMGLFIAQQIVQAHGGSLRHVPEERHTTFEARFPAQGPGRRG